MGILTTWRERKYEAAIEAAYYPDPSALPIATPWGSSDMQRIVFDDVFGTDHPVNTRAAAMRIPTVARARNLIVSSIAGNPLVSMRGPERVPSTPTWLTSADGGASPQLRMAWTVDDLMFYGWSCWSRRNAADTFPAAAGRIPYGDWTINDDNRVEVNGIEVNDDEVIVIPGLFEGILTAGYDVLRDTRTLYENVRKRLATPTPGLNLEQTDGRDMTDPEIDALIARWAAARRGEHAGVSFTSKGIKAVDMPGDDGNLMIESRNAAAVDLARIVGISAGLVDATAPKASLNYETQQGRNEEFVDRDLALYMLPITARLSLDDVTPHGQRVAFDTEAFTGPDQPNTGPTLED